MFDELILFAQIMLINMVLSGDNAVVIGMASKDLSATDRRKAVWWGMFGAIALRLLLTVIAVQLLAVPYIQAIGAGLLFIIAIKLLKDDGDHSRFRGGKSMLQAVRTIIIADFVMSLDNVLAIAAKADGNLTVVVLGIGMSIPIIIWGSHIVMELLHKYPILVFLGAGILGYTGGEMLTKEPKLSPVTIAFAIRR